MKKDLTHMNKMIEAEKHPLRSTAADLGLSPIYFDANTLADITQYTELLVDISRKCWSYFGYSGLLTPWHDSDPKSLLKYQSKSLRALLVFLKTEDINIESYCALSGVLSDYSRYERPALLFCYRPYWSWLAKLRRYAGGSSRVDEVADFVMCFVLLQVEYMGGAFLSENSVKDKDFSDGGKMFLSTFHRLMDRINQLSALGIDSKDWLREKFKIAYNSVPDQKVYINTIVNLNAFDPNVEELRSKLKDPWREVREFLQLSDECEFPDGFIPKGWNISSSDAKDLEKVVKVMGDGFYYYKDNSQRRGVRHYASNRYFIIKCDYSNFGEFKSRWHDAAMLSAKPTWDEYSRWAMYPGVWDENGKSLRHTKDVKWRKK
jgi:hypothetical protein